MKKLYSFITCLALGASLNAYAGPPQRIDVEDDTETKIYAVGITNKGVYTFGTASDTPSRISGSTVIQYSFVGSGGTFTDENTLYGTASNYGSVYAVKATAEGNGEDGSWSHVFYNYRENGVTFPKTLIANDMTYNAVDGKIYGIFQADIYGSSYCLGTYDGEAHAMTKIADLPAYTTINAIAADKDGNLYGINGAEGKLVAIDKTTAGLTEVGALGVTATATNQSAAIDFSKGKMYWVAGSNAYSTTQSLYEVDIETGAAKKLYDIESNRYNGLWIAPPKTDKKAPAAVENLMATFTGTGTDVQISFKAPSKTFGGSDLNGSLTYVIRVDGNELDRDTCEPGADFSGTFTMETGLHKVSVVCSNNSGDGAEATTEVFAGYDTPAAISNLTVSVENSEVTLTWDAPVSANGGLLDMDRLSYTVTRNPGNVEVVSGLKEYTCTDILPEGPAAIYSWTVTLKYEGSDDQSITAGGIMAGTPHKVPYRQNFDGLDTFADGCFAEINKSGDSPAWALAEKDGNKYAVMEAKYYYDHDDYLISAPLDLKAGKEYTLRFKTALSAESPTYWDYSTGSAMQIPRPFVLDVYLTKGHSAAESDKVAPSITDGLEITATAEEAATFTEHEYKFSVEEGGTYNICFADTKSAYFLQNIALWLDDVELTADFATPAPVDNLSAEETEFGSRDVVITFNAPSLDIDGNPLDELSSIEIYRGTTHVVTLDENILPGAPISYTDVNSPRGIHSYNVVACNGEMRSDPKYKSVRSGFINNLEIVSCSMPEKLEKDGEETILVTITNNAFETAVDYRVTILAGEKEIGSEIGEPINPDETKDYTFSLCWISSLPETLKLRAHIEFFGDESLENNTSEEYTVHVEGSEAGTDGIEAQTASLAADGNMVSVKGAEGKTVRAFTADGSMVMSSDSHGNNLTINLNHGVYIITVDNQIFKITL